MSDGFKANAAYFKLGFLDKNAVALGRQFKEMLPTLWMKAGAYGPCPALDGVISDVLLFPENKFAVLTEETSFPVLEATSRIGLNAITRPVICNFAIIIKLYR